MRISDWSSDVCSSDLAESAPFSMLLQTYGAAATAAAHDDCTCSDASAPTRPPWNVRRRPFAGCETGCVVATKYCGTPPTSPSSARRSTSLPGAESSVSTTVQLSPFPSPVSVDRRNDDNSYQPGCSSGGSPHP